MHPYITVALVVVVGYLGYDYGKKSEIKRTERVEAVLALKSVELADTYAVLKKTLEEKRHEILAKISRVPDESGCLDKQPPLPIRDGVREQQRREHQD